jgi:rhodanese-related sulfurtransferase
LRDSNLVIVDVREAHEFDAGHLPNSIHIPVAQLANRLNEIPPTRTPVFLCRSGGRSLTACGIASRAGIQPVAQLEGGLLAWEREVDQSFVVAMV